MKKLLGILVLGFMLNSCGTPGHYSRLPGSGHKASVITWDGGYGLSKNQPTIEFAVMGAFRACEEHNTFILCELDYIDDREIFDIVEKREWKNKYTNNKHKFEFTIDVKDYFIVRKK